MKIYFKNKSNVKCVLEVTNEDPEHIDEVLDELKRKKVSFIKPEDFKEKNLIKRKLYNNDNYVLGMLSHDAKLVNKFETN